MAKEIDFDFDFDDLETEAWTDALSPSKLLVDFSDDEGL